MKLINISTPKHPNTFTQVDDSDFEELNKHKWHWSRGYAVRRRPKVDGGGTVRMHRVILNTPEGMETDHKYGDKLDNQRANIRICTKAQNTHNTGTRKDNTSGYKGVYWNNGRKKWQAQITVDGKLIGLGRFCCVLEAANAYDKKAKELFGEFAHTNF